MEMRSNLRFCAELALDARFMLGEALVRETTVGVAEVETGGLLHATNSMSTITKAETRGDCSFLAVITTTC